MCAVQTKSKPAAKKATDKKKPGVRGNTYVLTASGKKGLADIGGQGAIIRDCLASNGPLTSAQIDEKVGKKIGATSKKAIGYYLCQWKNDGFVKFGPKPKA